MRACSFSCPQQLSDLFVDAAALTDGQKFAPAMGYASLPKAVVDLELKALEKIKIK